MTEIGNRQALDLEALKELADKATVGPWEVREARTPGYMPHYGVGSPRFPTIPDVVYARSDWEGYGNGSSRSDAAFIAAARTAVPALVAEVERLRSTCCALFEELAVKDQAIEDIRALAAYWKKFVTECPGATPTQAGMDASYIECADEIQRVLADLSARLDQDKGDNDE